jgi:hypothetical protein
MRCEFFVKATGAIHVIPEFEVDGLCLLEGRNGIGKTLAVHLLELVTGRQPYVVAQSAWNSLKAGVSELRIRISGLRGGDTLEIELTPSTWPDTPTNGPMSLGHAWHNGQSIDFLMIPRILRVTRIGGDEDIVTQFQRVIAADSAVVGRQLTRLITSIPLLIQVYAKLSQDINAISRTALDQLIAHQKQAEDRFASETQANERQSAIVQALEQLRRKQTALQHLKEKGPNIELRLAEVENELDKLGLDINQLEIRHSQHLPNAQREQKLLKEIEQSRSRQASQTELLRVATTKLNDALAELQLSNINDIVSAQQQTKAEHDELVRDREQLVASHDLIALIREIRVKLETVRGSSLDMEVVANIRQRLVRVRELRDGLVQRERELNKKDQQTFSAVIDDKIQSLKGQMKRLDDAAKLQKDLVQKQKILAETEEVLHNKTIALDMNRDAEYLQIAEELQRLRKCELKLIEDRAELRYVKSMLEEHGTLDQLAAEIASIRNSLPETTETFEEAQTTLAILKNRLQEAHEEQEQAKNDLAAFDRKLEDALMLLNLSPDYDWLRKAVADQLPTTNDDRSMALERLARIEQAIQRLDRILNTLRRSTAQLQDALNRLARNSAEEMFNSSDSYWPVIIAHYEKQFGTLLGDQNVRHALFDNGTFIRLDLQKQAVIWKDAYGDICRRPLEAFSSGERAFAYVLGSILQQRQVTAQNHLLVLDEFGAFIEASRIEWLERFLHDEVLGAGGASAVVIMLPLREPIPSANDGLDKRTQMLIERGYTMKEVKIPV